MKKIKLRIDMKTYATIHQQLIESNTHEDEALCFLYCIQAEGKSSITFIPKVVIPIPNEELDNQSRYAVGLGTELLNKIYQDFAQSEYPCLISCHSHPFDMSAFPRFSSIDDRNDISQAIWYSKEIVGFRRKKSNQKQPPCYLHLVKSQKGLAVRLYDTTTRAFYPVDCQYYTESALCLSSLRASVAERGRDDFRNRTDAAFGKGLSDALETLTVGVVGAGGIGSIIVEGLARLGVRNLILIDPDTIEMSNLNRFQGAGLDTVGKYKVEVLSDYLKHLFSGRINVQVSKASVFSPEAFTLLKDADLVLGCLDNNGTRYFLNRFSLQYLVPYIDGGTRIIPGKDRIGIPIKVGTVIPSVTSCMDCSVIDYYTDEEIFFEVSDVTTKDNLRKSGYIKDMDSVVNPAVYPQNLLVAGTMLLEVMNLFGHYKSPVNNMFYDISTFSDCLNAEQKRLACPHIFARAESKQDCLNCDYYLGMADSLKITGLEGE